MCESSDIEPSGLGDAALAELVVELQAQSDRLEALRLRALGEWDARAVWALDGACNGASWLAALGNVARAPMSGLLHDARRLRAMPVTAGALNDGSLAPAKARLLARAVNDRTREAFERDEQTLVDTIAGLTVDDAAQLIRYWQRAADPTAPTRVTVTPTRPAWRRPPTGVGICAPGSTWSRARSCTACSPPGSTKPAGRCAPRGSTSSGWARVCGPTR